MQSDGITPITDGAHSIVFNIYTASSGGSALFSRTISVTTAKGLYTCIIGGGTGANAALNTTEMNQLGSQQTYIGIAVDGGGELLPRAQLTPSAYAFQAQSAYTISDNAVTTMKLADNTVNSNKILDGSIMNADINVSAAIADSKLATISSPGKVLGDAITSGTISGSTQISTSSGTGNTIYAQATSGVGVYGRATTNGYGVYAQSQSGYGIYATSNTADAGYFNGSVTVANGLYVTGLTGGVGTLGVTNRSYFTATSSTSLVHDVTSTSGIAIRADGNIVASSGGAFIATSDRRTKEVIAKTDNERDLNDLLRIEITDYRFIDKITNGGRLQKKVIAQQLLGTYPIAVTMTDGIVPNVFEVAKKVEVIGNKTRIQTFRPHQFASLDEVKLILEKRGEKKYIVDVISENEFTVAEPINESVFVYGKKVNDLLNVDYDALTTLNISATQQLNKEIETLREKLLIESEANKMLEQRLYLIETKLAKTQQDYVTIHIEKP